MYTDSLLGEDLDKAVCEVLGIPYSKNFELTWEIAGPIIEKEKISTWSNGMSWVSRDYDLRSHETRGSTPLISAMRCFVTIHLGRKF